MAKKYTTAQVDAFEKRSHAERLARLKAQKGGNKARTSQDAMSNLIGKRLKHTKPNFKPKGK